MDAQLPIILHMAIAADLFTVGRGKEFATQDTMIWYAETAPMGIRNMAKKRAPSAVVPVAMAFPIVATSIKLKMCRERSPLREEVYVTRTETRKVANQTTAHRS